MKRKIALLALLLATGLGIAFADKISEFSAILGADIDSAVDRIPISDMSGTATTKYTTVADLEIAMGLDGIAAGVAGVSLTGDGDGAIAFLGLGNGSDENMIWNLDDTSNTIVVSSTTGVSLFDFGSIGFTTGPLNKVTLTAPATSATLTIADGKTLTASNTLTFTGTDASSVAFGTGGTVVYTANHLGALAATTSAQFAGVISDETGTGVAVLATSPTLVTPVLGVAAATSVNKIALTAPATGATLTIAEGKTLTASNTLTFTGTDASSVAFGTGGTVVYTANHLGALAATTSAQFAGVISDETGTGVAVLATSPTLVTPVLGVAAATSLNTGAGAWTFGAVGAATITSPDDHLVVTVGGTTYYVPAKLTAD